MYHIQNRPLDIPLIVNCDDSSVVKHGLNSALMVERVRESKVALEALRKELMSAASGTRSVRQANWNKSPHLVRWFGEFSELGTIRLYSRCTRILTALGNPLYEIKCAEKLGKLAGRGGYLRVVIYAAVVGRQSHQEQLATVIHEVGHAVVAGADFRYYPDKCLPLAQNHPAIARVNLDNLAYCAVECIGYEF
jgi:hypothetical protein